MKCLLTVLALGFCSGIEAQNPCYRAIVLKTNVLTLFQAALEFPVYHRLSAELSYRYYPKGTLYPGFDSKRVNIKYHFTFNNWKSHVPSMYIFTGVNRLKEDIDRRIRGQDEVQSGHLDVVKIPIGIGLRYRRVNFWVAFEPIVVTYNNIYTTHSITSGAGYSEKKWRTYDYVSAGLSLSILNIQLPFTESEIYRTIAR